MNSRKKNSEVKKGSHYVCNICHEYEYKESVLRSDAFQYETQMFDKNVILTDLNGFVKVVIKQ